MKHRGCPYRAGVRGRSFQSIPGVGGPSFTARVLCSRCKNEGVRPCRSDHTPHQLDAKFTNIGWALDPHICPDCLRAPAKGSYMASSPSPAAMKAQANMFQLISQHFDSDKGAYAVGWTDERIAKECGLAADMVTSFRRAGFGEIKEPSEVRALRADINALEQLQRETSAQMTQDIAGMRSRLAEISKRWAA